MRRLLNFALFGGLVAAGAVLLSGRASAAPVRPVTATIVQPDGTSFHARPWGDEHRTGYETTSGYSVVRGSDGYWYYASGRDGSWGLEPSNTRATANAPAGTAKHARPAGSAVSTGAEQLTAQAPPGGNHTGSEKLLVILGEYSSYPHQTADSAWETSFFATSGRTLRTFYRQSSYNIFDVVPAHESCGTANNDGIAGWVNLGSTNPNIKLGDSHDIAEAAVSAVDGCVDFDSFDADHDGFVSARELHIIVILAGNETSYTGMAAANQCGPSVWGHNTDFYPAVFADGDVLASYSMFGEMHCYRSGPTDDRHQATLGIMVHEFGHDIGWPDLYDIDYSSSGIGAWSIMSGGSWSYSSSDAWAGESPSLPDAFSKSYQGWVTPTEITTTQSGVAVDEGETNADVYRLLPNSGGVDWSFYGSSGLGEYYLIENRNAPASGFDAGLPGCGLLVWHIDETRTSTNSTNANESRPLVKLVQADGNNDLEHGSDDGDAGDPYPGSSGNNDLNDSTTPSTHLYSGLDSGVGLSTSSLCGSTMQADFFVGPSVRISNVSMKEGRRGQRNFVFKVTLSRQPTAAVSIDVATADGSARQPRDYIANVETLTFNPGDPLEQTFTVLVNGDRRRERNERFSVFLTNPTGNLFVSDGQGIGTIRNDD